MHETSLRISAEVFPAVADAARVSSRLRSSAGLLDSTIVTTLALFAGRPLSSTLRVASPLPVEIPTSSQKRSYVTSNRPVDVGKPGVLLLFSSV